MTDPESTFWPPFFKGPKSFHQAVGEAIEAYAFVEGELAQLLGELLKVKPQIAFAVFSSIQNTRARGELFQDLLDIEFGGRLKKHWADCNKFLLVLARFRNALAHWHPHMNIYSNEDGSKMTHVPAIGALSRGALQALEEKDIAPFIEDCRYIRQVIVVLRVIAHGGPSALSEKFPSQAIDRNRAVLRQRQVPKAPQRQRPPSIPKLSVAQKHAKALKDARKKK